MTAKITSPSLSEEQMKLLERIGRGEIGYRELKKKKDEYIGAIVTDPLTSYRLSLPSWSYIGWTVLLEVILGTIWRKPKLTVFFVASTLATRPSGLLAHRFLQKHYNSIEG